MGPALHRICVVAEQSLFRSVPLLNCGVVLYNPLCLFNEVTQPDSYHHFHLGDWLCWVCDTSKPNMHALLLFCELAVVLPHVHLACDDNSLRGAMCRAVIDYVRAHGPANLSATAMSPPIAEQIMAALDLIQGKDGSSRGAEKLQTLQQNAVYFRQGLQKMGCIVLGTGASPIVVSPMLDAHRVPCHSCFPPTVAAFQHDLHAS